MMTELPSKNKEGRYVKEHTARNEKKLAGKLEWLSVSNIRIISEYCQHWLPDPNAVIALTALLTGWSITDLLNSDTKLWCDSSGTVHLVCPWHFTAPEVNSSLRKNLYCPEDSGVIPLPIYLGILLREVLMHHNKKGATKESVKSFLAEISTEECLRITPTRVSNTLVYYASDFGINKFECRLISGQAKREAGQNYYICFDIGATFEKLYIFWDWVLVKTEWRYPTPPVQLFGSKRALKKSGVQEIFKWYECSILEKIVLNEKREAFNLYTLYIIDLLQFVTLCRPGDAIFGSLNNFDCSFESVFIQDKGVSSSRVLPLPKSIRPVLRNYVDYLKVTQEQSAFTDRQVHKELRKILDGTAPLFHFWAKYKVLPATNSEIKKRLAHFDIHRNWHRHTVMTALFEEGVCVNKIACFAGHQPTLDHWFSRYSSIDYKPVIEVSSQIELLVHRWKIPLLPDLSNRVHGR